MTNRNFTDNPDRNVLAKGGGKPSPTGVRGKTKTKMNMKPGPAGGLPGASQRRSRNPGDAPSKNFHLKPEGL